MRVCVFACVCVCVWGGGGDSCITSRVQCPAAAAVAEAVVSEEGDDAGAGGGVAHDEDMEQMPRKRKHGMCGVAYMAGRARVTRCCAGDGGAGRAVRPRKTDPFFRESRAFEAATAATAERAASREQRIAEASCRAAEVCRAFQTPLRAACAGSEETEGPHSAAQAPRDADVARAARDEASDIPPSG